MKLEWNQNNICQNASQRHIVCAKYSPISTTIIELKNCCEEILESQHCKDQNSNESRATFVKCFPKVLCVVQMFYNLHN
jgi:hypothetical protein